MNAQKTIRPPLNSALLFAFLLLATAGNAQGGKSPAGTKAKTKTTATGVGKTKTKTTSASGDKTKTKTTVPGTGKTKSTKSVKEKAPETVVEVESVEGKYDVVGPPEVEAAAAPAAIEPAPDVEAQFPGGDRSWVKYVTARLKSPEGSPKGTYNVAIEFVVETDGSLTDLHASTDPGFGFAAAAKKVLQGGPKWIPAQKNGKPVRSVRSQSFTFVNTD